MKEYKKKILMTLSNPYKPDNRVEKEAKSLIDAGYSVTILAWDRECKYPANQEYDRIKVHRIQVQSLYKSGLSNIFKILLFYFHAFKYINKKKFHIVHCHDLDTLFVGVVAKIIYKCFLIYDAHEYYPEMVFQPYIIRKMLAYFEIVFIFYADKIFVASSYTAKKLKKHTLKNVYVINNAAKLSDYKIYTDDIMNIKKKLCINEDQIIVTYIGGYSKNRRIKELAFAAKGLKNITVLIVGDMTGTEIPEIAEEIKNIKYLGWIQPEEVPLFTKLSDVCYYVYDPKSRYSDYVNPNGLFNALAAGKPIICTDVGDMGDIVRKERCGFLVEEPTINNIKKILSTITKRTKLIQEYTENAQRVSAERYNWLYNEKIIIYCYSRLNC